MEELVERQDNSKSSCSQIVHILIEGAVTMQVVGEIDNGSWQRTCVEVERQGGYGSRCALSCYTYLLRCNHLADTNKILVADTNTTNGHLKYVRMLQGWLDLRRQGCKLIRAAYM